MTPQTNTSSLPYDYTINPYRGCQFGCAYCYASRFVFEDQNKKLDWGYWVEAKSNAVEALQRDSHKMTGKSIYFSSATDPYQPIETQLGLSRALLDVILASFPERLHIQTRSPLVLRDVEIMERFGDSLTVGISIPTDSDFVRKAFEPRAPSIGSRIKSAAALKRQGIFTIAAVAPLLPSTPTRLAKLIAPHFDSAWVGRLQFYEKQSQIQHIYHQKRWQRFLLPEHYDAVELALVDAGLRTNMPV